MMKFIKWAKQWDGGKYFSNRKYQDIQENAGWNFTAKAIGIVTAISLMSVKSSSIAEGIGMPLLVGYFTYVGVKVSVGLVFAHFDIKNFEKQQFEFAQELELRRKLEEGQQQIAVAIARYIAESSTPNALESGAGIAERADTRSTYESAVSENLAAAVKPKEIKPPKNGDEGSGIY